MDGYWEREGVGRFVWDFGIAAYERLKSRLCFWDESFLGKAVEVPCVSLWNSGSYSRDVYLRGSKV